jgi:hypothetical protein
LVKLCINNRLTPKMPTVKSNKLIQDSISTKIQALPDRGPCPCPTIWGKFAA